MFSIKLIFLNTECITKSGQTRQQNLPLKILLQFTDVNFMTTIMIPKGLSYFHLTINERKSHCFYVTIQLTTLCGGKSTANHTWPEISDREPETQKEFSGFHNGCQSELYFGFLHHVAIKRSIVSEKHTAFIFRVTDLGQVDDEIQRNQSVIYIGLFEHVWPSSYGRWEKETG